MMGRRKLSWIDQNYLCKRKMKVCCAMGFKRILIWNHQVKFFLYEDMNLNQVLQIHVWTLAIKPLQLLWLLLSILSLYVCMYHLSNNSQQYEVWIALAKVVCRLHCRSPWSVNKSNLKPSSLVTLWVMCTPINQNKKFNIW
jgi:hypothetical protein